MSGTRGKRQAQRLLAAVILGLSSAGEVARADDNTDTINSLKQENQQLKNELKAIRDDFEKKMKSLEEQFDQKVKVVDRKREVETEAANAKWKEEFTTAKSKFGLPEWVTSVRLIDDLRIRYDGMFAPDSDFVSRHRIRPRLRLGGIATLQDDFDIGFRLASAPSVGKDTGGDPLSTNQTFEDNASRKPVGIDWAFVRWNPIHTDRWTGSFGAGKMDNPPNFTEDVFDVDYTPEGLSQQFAFKLNKNHTLSSYFGQYMLDELQVSGKDPFLFVEQLHLESKWNPHVSTAFTLSGLSIVNAEQLTNAAVPDSNHGNTRNAAGVLQNDYQLLIADGSLTYTLDRAPFYNGPFPITLYGEYIQNFGADRNNTGFSFGPTFGKVSQRNYAGVQNQKGRWEISYRYQELQGDANYEELTASDNGAFYRERPPGEPPAGGAPTFRPTFFNGLNLRGHAFRVAYAPYNSLVLDARLWLNEPIEALRPSDKVQGVRFLFDTIWKF